MPFPTDDEMRKHFHTLRKKERALHEQLAGDQEAYNEARAQECAFHDAHVAPLIAKMKPVKDELNKVQDQIGQVTRFLRKGKFAATGEGPAQT